MKTWKTKITLAVAAVAPLLFCGCNSVVLENPLPTIVNDAIVGSWAKPNGDLEMVIKKGEGDSYIWIDSSEATDNDAASKNAGEKVYLAKAGDMLFLEAPVKCDDYLFKPPKAADAPHGCWEIVRLEMLSDNKLRSEFLDTNAMLQKALAGCLNDVNMVFEVKTGSSSRSNSFDSDVLIEGQPGEVSAFLAEYAEGDVYHRELTSQILHKM